MTSKYERKNPWSSEAERMAAARSNGGQQSRINRGLEPAVRKRNPTKTQWCYRCGADHDRHG